jgi:hypothetical protein
MGHSAWSSYFRFGVFYSLMAALWISFLENRSPEKLLAPGKRCVPFVMKTNSRRRFAGSPVGNANCTY